MKAWSWSKCLVAYLWNQWSICFLGNDCEEAGNIACAENEINIWLRKRREICRNHRRNEAHREMKLRNVTQWSYGISNQLWRKYRRNDRKLKMTEIREISEAGVSLKCLWRGKPRLERENVWQPTLTTASTASLQPAAAQRIATLPRALCSSAYLPQRCWRYFAGAASAANIAAQRFASAGAALALPHWRALALEPLIVQ